MDPQAAPLTIKQLHDFLGELITQGQGEKALEIPYQPGFATLGGSPAVKIKAVFNGFDWDQGRFFLVPEKTLGIPSEEASKRLRHMEHVIGRMHLAASSGQADDGQRLETLRGYLRQLGDELAGRKADQALG